MPPSRLTEEQVNWLSLLDSLGSDDIAEFTALITARQQRNRRLVEEMMRSSEGGKFRYDRKSNTDGELKRDVQLG